MVERKAEIKTDTEALAKFLSGKPCSPLPECGEKKGSYQVMTDYKDKIKSLDCTGCLRKINPENLQIIEKAQNGGAKS